MDDHVYYEKQSKQDRELENLKTKIDYLQGEVAKYKDKDHQALNERIRNLEKWIWGAGAVIAAIMAGFGLMENFEFGYSKTNRMVKEHRLYFKDILHPAMVRSNWLGEDYSDLEGVKPPEWIEKK